MSAAHKYLPPDAILYLYKTTIRQMEYCCHIWGGASTCHLSLLDRVQKCIVNLIGDELGTTLQSHHRSIATLSLFFRYYHRKCSTGLSILVPPVRSVKIGFPLLTHTH